MPMVYGNWGPGVQGAMSPALDALQLLGSASSSSGMRPNENRLTESDYWGSPNPANGAYLQPPPTAPVRSENSYPPPATPPNEIPFGIPNKPRREAPYKNAMDGLMTALPGPKLEQ